MHTFTFPGHPTPLNKLLGDWRRAATRKKQDRRTIGTAFKLVGIPLATGKRRVSLVIVLGPRQRGADPDGYFKSLLDALQACGALADDRRQCVELGPVSYERGPAAETRVMLEDLQAPARPPAAAAGGRG